MVPPWQVPPLEQQIANSLASKRHGKKPVPQRIVTSIIDGLKQIYFHKVLLIWDTMPYPVSACLHTCAAGGVGGCSRLP
jgi:hypothetical protein